MFASELLEGRRLLSVSVRFDPTFGTLDVVSNGKGNEIRVTIVEAEQALTTPQLAPTADRTARHGPFLRGVSAYDGMNLIFNSFSASRRPLTFATCRCAAAKAPIRSRLCP